MAGLRDDPARGGLVTPAERPVERFRPTSGQLLGWTTVVACVLLLGWLAIHATGATGLRVGLGVLLLAVLTYATQLRPRAVLYADRIVLRNAFRDSVVPLALVDEVGVGRTLNVFVGEERFVCIGIGRSLRRVLGHSQRGGGLSGLLGFDRLVGYHRQRTPAPPDQSAMHYDTFVVTRIEAQVEEVMRGAARNPSRTNPPMAPRATQHWALPSLVLHGASALAFVVALLA